MEILLLFCMVWSSTQAGPIVDTVYGALEGATEYNNDGEILMELILSGVIAKKM